MMFRHPEQKSTLRKTSTQVMMTSAQVVKKCQSTSLQTVLITLMMTSAQDIEMSVNALISSLSQDYTHPDNQASSTYEITNILTWASLLETVQVCGSCIAAYSI